MDLQSVTGSKCWYWVWPPVDFPSWVSFFCWGGKRRKSFADPSKKVTGMTDYTHMDISEMGRKLLLFRGSRQMLRFFKKIQLRKPCRGSLVHHQKKEKSGCRFAKKWHVLICRHRCEVRKDGLNRNTVKLPSFTFVLALLQRTNVLHLLYDNDTIRSSGLTCIKPYTA